MEKIEKYPEHDSNVPPPYTPYLQPAGTGYPQPPPADRGQEQQGPGAYTVGYAAPAGATVIIGANGNCPRCHVSVSKIIM